MLPRLRRLARLAALQILPFSAFGRKEFLLRVARGIFLVHLERWPAVVNVGSSSEIAEALRGDHPLLHAQRPNTGSYAKSW
jgi:hypothetical protein